MHTYHIIMLPTNTIVFKINFRVKCSNIFENVIKFQTKHSDRRLSFGKKIECEIRKQRLNLLLFYITFLCKYYYFSNKDTSQMNYSTSSRLILAKI